MVNIRKLKKNDYYKQYLNLLSQLTNYNIDTKTNYKSFKKFINNKFQKIYVIEINKQIIASITLIIESKVIHNFKKVCHIEDLVIDKKWRGQGLSKKLIDFSRISKAKKYNCYKIILNCNKSLEKFYISNNFYQSGIQMRLDI